MESSFEFADSIVVVAQVMQDVGYDRVQIDGLFESAISAAVTAHVVYRSDQKGYDNAFQMLVDIYLEDIDEYLEVN